MICIHYILGLPLIIIVIITTTVVLIWAEVVKVNCE